MHINFSGENVYEVTPVPIPNTEVKLVIAEDSKRMPLVKIGICQIFLCLKIGKICKIQLKYTPIGVFFLLKFEYYVFCPKLNSTYSTTGNYF